MNTYLAVSVTIAALVGLSVARSWLGRRGWVLDVAVTYRRPQKAPRLPVPPPGCVSIPVVLTHDFFVMARQGVTGVTTLRGTGDGESWTLHVEQTQPQAE